MMYVAVLLIFLLSACAPVPKLVPRESQVVKKEDNTLLYEEDNVKVLVRSNAWKYSPSDLTSYITPIYVEVKNLSDKGLIINRQDVYLMDERGNQYNALSPSDVVSAVAAWPDVSFSIGMAYYSSPFWFGWYPYYPYPTARSYPDIANYAFIYGSIEPGAVLKGFVYFQKVPKDVKSLSLKIVYHMAGERKAVSFPFDVIR